MAREIGERMGATTDAIRGVLLRIRLARPAPFRMESIPNAEATVRQLFAEGKKDRKIHGAMGLPREVTVGIVRSYRLRLGLKHQVAPTPISDAEFETVSALVDEGHSATQICATTGVTKSRLRNLCIKFGLEIEGKARRCIPSDEAERWAKALSGKAYESWDIPSRSTFKQLPPPTFVPTESSAGMAAL